jgi:pyridoxamine 5'-phosphate oxidase
MHHEPAEGDVESSIVGCMHDPDMRRFRIEYEVEGMGLEAFDEDPFRQFERWFDDAASSGMVEPNAMIVSTVSEDGQPTARAMLLKGLVDEQFVFYTNYESRKGKELAANPQVCLLFAWIPMHRQIRIDGVAERVPPEESDRYFASRPIGARLGGSASPQSQVIPHRDWLKDRVAELEERFPEGDIPRPEHWGGFAVTPTEFEFWQGQPNRLHDRIRYRLEGGWIRERLAP